MQPGRTNRREAQAGGTSPSGGGEHATIVSLVPKPETSRESPDEPPISGGSRTPLVFPLPATARSSIRVVDFRRRERRRWEHWLAGGTLILLGGMTLFIVGLVDIGALSVLGYFLLIAGGLVIAHACALHRRACLRGAHRSARSRRSEPGSRIEFP